MNTHILGQAGEAISEQFLISKGYEILKMNYHTYYGEIDIIAKDAENIIFVEVKTRRNLTATPSTAVGFTKQKKIIKTAIFYINTVLEEKNQLSPRFDILEVWKQNGKFKIHHIKNAFICTSEMNIFTI